MKCVKSTVCLTRSHTNFIDKTVQQLITMNLSDSEKLLYQELQVLLGGNISEELEPRLRYLLSGNYNDSGCDVKKVLTHVEEPRDEEPSPPSSPNAKRVRLMQQLSPHEHCPTLLHLSLQYNGYDFWGTTKLLEIAGEKLVGVPDGNGYRALDIIMSHDDQYWPTLALVIKWTPVDKFFQPSSAPGCSFIKNDSDEDVSNDGEYNLVDVIVHRMEDFHGVTCEGVGYGQLQSVISSKLPLFLHYVVHGYPISDIYSCMRETVHMVIEVLLK